MKICQRLCGQHLRRGALLLPSSVRRSATVVPAVPAPTRLGQHDPKSASSALANDVVVLFVKVCDVKLDSCASPPCWQTIGNGEKCQNAELMRNHLRGCHLSASRAAPQDLYTWQYIRYSRDKRIALQLRGGACMDYQSDRVRHWLKNNPTSRANVITGMEPLRHCRLQFRLPVEEKARHLGE